MIRFPIGLRYMAAAAFFFSLMSVLAKALGREIPSQEIVLVRGFVTVALSYAALRRARVSAWGNRRGLLWLRGFLGFLALSAFFFAITHLPLADATVIQYTNPVFTALIAAAVLSERLRPRDVVSLATSLAGVVLIARPALLFGTGEGELDPLAVGIALAGAILSAAAYVSVRSLSRTEHPLVIVHYFAVAVVIGSIPTAAPSLVMPSPVAWLGLVGLGVTTHIAQLYMTRGLALEPAGRAMTAAYIQIVFAAVWGALFFGEMPDALKVVGGSLIVASTLWLASGTRLINSGLQHDTRN